jgi:hypothetical protein
LTLLNEIHILYEGRPKEVQENIIPEIQNWLGEIFMPDLSPDRQHIAYIALGLRLFDLGLEVYIKIAQYQNRDDHQQD